MDALRKAEEAKRAAQAEGAPPQTPDAMSTPVPDYSLEAGADGELALEPLTQTSITAPAAGPTAATPVGPQPAHSAAQEQAQRNTIQNAFAAKSTGGSPGDRAFAIALFSVAGLALAGIGAYVWWQMQPRNTLAVPSTVTPTVAAPQAPLPAASIQAVEPASSTAVALESAIKEKIESFEKRYLAPPVEPKASPVRITQSKARVNPLLEQGYAALQQGKLPQAQQAYERMLAIDPRNIDALYGLAAIAVHQQQPGLAEEYYLRILEADPRDALAHAGLAGLGGKAGSNAESRIKTLIAEQPNVPQLHFALGNLYAQAQRWRDAQQSYFQAYKNDSENPDIAFNLAVSLDQLHQDRLAAQYYNESLRLSANRPAAFSHEQVKARLLELLRQGGSQ